MEISSMQQRDVTVILVADDLDSSTAAEATAYLDAAIKSGRTKLVLDLGAVPYLSSAGLRVILGAMRLARGRGGDLRLVCAEGNVLRVVDMAGLTKLVQMYSTLEEAVASYVT